MSQTYTFAQPKIVRNGNVAVKFRIEFHKIHSLIMQFVRVGKLGDRASYLIGYRQTKTLAQGQNVSNQNALKKRNPVNKSRCLSVFFIVVFVQGQPSMQMI